MTEALRELPAARIVAFVADAAARWRDADFAPRVRATQAIRERLGYSEPVVDYALDRLFFALTAESLAAAIGAELGTVEALDGIVPRAGAPAAWARGVDRVAIVSSDSTIGVAVVPAVFALCAKCGVTVKDRSDALVAAFFATLAQEHPAFGAAARARAWRGGEDAEETELLAAADVVVAFGRDETLRAIRARCGVDARFVPFGHRVSVGLLRAGDVARLDDALAERIARDALLYDGEGCLSLHALFAEADGEALARLGATLAAACERVAIELPPAPADPGREARIAGWRNVAAFRAAGGRGAVYRGGAATVAIDVPPDEPPPLLPRIVPVYRGGADALAAYGAAQRLPVQALGVAAPDAEAVALAARLGAVRVAAFGSLQDPPVGGHHGGAPRIADFVRWIDRG